MKKITKRIPINVTKNVNGKIYEKEILTNDINKYFKRFSGGWKLIPLDIIIVDGKEYFTDARGNLREFNSKAH